MLTVHHMHASQSERIVWLCEELEIPYELKRYPRDPSGAVNPLFKQIHPQGSAPAITDGELVMAESGAIVAYIIATYGEGRLSLAPGNPDFPHYLYWYHFANGTMMPRLLYQMISAGGSGPDSPAARRFHDRVASSYAMVEQRLGAVSYFAGQAFTAADIMMFFPLTTVRLNTKRAFQNEPNIQAYVKRVGERPAYKRAMEKADPGWPLQLE